MVQCGAVGPAVALQGDKHETEFCINLQEHLKIIQAFYRSHKRTQATMHEANKLTDTALAAPISHTAGLSVPCPVSALHMSSRPILVN